MYCFSGEMVVRTVEGIKPMRELDVGDLVLTIEESLVCVLWNFTRKLPKTRAFRFRTAQSLCFYTKNTTKTSNICTFTRKQVIH